MANIKKSMRGRQIDLDQLRIKHEKTIALGNMNVNAAGDELGPGGLVKKTSSQRIKQANALHTMRPQDIPVQARAKVKKPHVVAPAVSEAEAILDEADAPVTTKAIKKKTTTKKKKS